MREKSGQTELLPGKGVAGTQSTVSNAPDGIIIIDSNNLIKSFNPVAEGIFGYPAAGVIGQNVQILMPGAVRSQNAAPGQKGAGKGDTFKARREVTGRRKDGRGFPVELAISGYSAGDKLLIVRDITERKQAEEKLFLMARVSENVSDGIVVIGADGAVQLVNPAFTKITWYAEKDVTGRPPEFWANGQPGAARYQRLLSSIEKKGVWRKETQLMRQDGKKVPILLKFTGIRDDQGNVAQFVGVFTDISEQVKIRKERRQLREQSARAQRFATLSAMSAGFAHEIRQPLNSIKILTDGILYWQKRGRPLDNERIIENLHKISAQVMRIDEIIKYLRSFARADHVAETEPCNLNDAVNSAMEMLDRQMSTHGIAINPELSPDLPFVLGSANRLEEIAINLLVNAMQALDTVSKTEKEITCRTGRKGKTVYLEISDNATGIGEEVLDKIFEPFFSTKQTGVGMGLGVPIVQSVATSFNGQIEASNNEKAGATFRVSFPAVRREMKGGGAIEYSAGR